MKSTAGAPTDVNRLCRATLKIIPDIHAFIKRLLVDQPSKALQPIIFRIAGKPKEVIRADLDAEDHFDYLLHKALGKRTAAGIKVIGEESLLDPDLNLANEERVVALVDVLDGSDLYLRGLSNWCSAVIFFYPPERRILAAFVGQSSGVIYYTTESRSRLRLRPLKVIPGRGEREVNGPSEVRRVKDAAICFYGQKRDHFLSITAKRRKFRSFLKQQKDVKFRIYNLGGNPMMALVADGLIDAVLGLKGQAPHDVAPGAFIAQEAGAVFLNDIGERVEIEELLLRPAREEVRYIIAATRELYDDLMKLFAER